MDRPAKAVREVRAARGGQISVPYSEPRSVSAPSQTQRLGRRTRHYERMVHEPSTCPRPAPQQLDIVIVRVGCRHVGHTRERAFHGRNHGQPWPGAQLGEVGCVNLRPLQDGRLLQKPPRRVVGALSGRVGGRVGQHPVRSRRERRQEIVSLFDSALRAQRQPGRLSTSGASLPVGD